MSRSKQESEKEASLPPELDLGAGGPSAQTPSEVCSGQPARADDRPAQPASPTDADDDATRRFRAAMGCGDDPTAGVNSAPARVGASIPEVTAAALKSGDGVRLPHGSTVTVRRGNIAGVARPVPERAENPHAGGWAGVRVRTVALDAIDPAAARHTEQQLADLAASRKETIPIHPPVLRLRGKRYAVIAGAGRVEADRRAGLREITATVIPEGPEYDWLAEMVRIDENLRRVDPPPAERDKLILRRKQLWEQRHPETVGSGVLSAAGRKSAAKRKGTCDAASQVGSFVSETARATGKSKRTIQRSVARTEKAGPDVAAAYERSDVSPAQVDELAKLPKDKQGVVLAKVQGKTRDETRQAVREAQGQAHTASPSPPTPPVSSPRAVVRELVAALDAFNVPLNLVWRSQAEVVAKVGLPERTRLRDRLVKAAEILEKVGAALVPATKKRGPQKKPSSGRRR